MSGRLEPRVVDPSRCWVRHVRRTQAGETVGATIAAATFTAQPLDALGGRGGWQSATVDAALNADGTLAVKFPNGAGEDGVLHRRRFALLTDPAYRVGEEWLELYREPYDVVAVGSPSKWNLDRGMLTLTCVDVAVHLAAFRGSELDVWDGHAPRDVIEHYTRARTLVTGTDFAGTAPTSAASWAGWDTDGTVTVSPSGRPRITAVAAWSGMSRAIDVLADCWTAEARVRFQAAAPGFVLLRLGAFGAIANDVWLQVDQAGVTSFGVPGLTAEAGKRQGLTIPSTVSIRLIARYDRLFALVNGELVDELRRPSPFVAPARVGVQAWTATVDVDELHVEDLTPYALRGADKGDRMLGGSPPPVGLRARYYNAAGVYVNSAAQADRLARLFKLGDEPITERLDATLDVAAGAAGFPPNLPGAWAARWVGSIYLDLASGDRRIRLTPAAANARVYVGRTMRDDPAASSWSGAAGTVLTTPALRAHLGTSRAGWYPLVIELASPAGMGGAALKLEDGPADGSGYAVTPTSRLSPVGVVEDELRHEAHRAVIDSVTETFGLQWRVEPRALESGEFPGQLIPRVRVGRDSELVIDDAEGVDLQTEGDAADAIDSLIADAAGIADPKGSGQLSAELLDHEAAAAHLGIATGYETLSEISEAQMLETRLGSLLALRSSPNEQVGVRPTGQQDLADTFPLTGQLALMQWRPGDGVRLNLDDLDVIDRTPRQMTGVQRVHVPAGVTAPTVTFRDRPRSAAAILKRTLRAVNALSRNYQGTLALLGGGYVTATLAAAGATGFSYLPLPQNLDDVAAAYVDVAVLNTGQVTLEVNGTAGPVANAVGRYDVTSLVRPLSSTDRRAYARAINASVGLTIELQLVLILRI